MPRSGRVHDEGRRRQDADAPWRRWMKPSSCLMTGNRVNLARVGRSSCSRGCKRHRPRGLQRLKRLLEVEETVTAMPPGTPRLHGDASDEDDEEDDRVQGQAMGPFGTARHVTDLGTGGGTLPTTSAALPRRPTLRWPPAFVLSDAPRTASASLPRTRDGVGQTEAPAEAVVRKKDSDSMADNHREQDWSQLPPVLLVDVFGRLDVQDVGRCAQVCRGWRRASQEPCLWRTAEFVLGTTLRPEPTSPALVNFILEEHAQHLKFVVLRTDSSAEAAHRLCRVLDRLGKCSLKTLAFMSGTAARPALVDVDVQFASALSLVLERSSPSLRALAVDHTLVDDPSLRALAGERSGTTSLQMLRCKSCPRLSPGGVLALVDHCRWLRELSLSYSLLSDELLHALSSERNVCLEVLRVDVDADNALRTISPSSWHALVAHSPQLNLLMYLFDIRDEAFDTLFASYLPVTYLYFGHYSPTSVLGRVAKHCPRLVELVVGANGNAVIDAQLSDIAANCQQLSALGLAECQVTCSALVAVAEACGPRLSQLVVMEECLVEDGVHDLTSACARLSEVLGRDWSPEFTPMW